MIRLTVTSAGVQPILVITPAARTIPTPNPPIKPNGIRDGDTDSMTTICRPEAVDQKPSSSAIVPGKIKLISSSMTQHNHAASVRHPLEGCKMRYCRMHFAKNGEPLLVDFGFLNQEQKQQSLRSIREFFSDYVFLKFYAISQPSWAASPNKTPSWGKR